MRQRRRQHSEVELALLLHCQLWLDFVAVELTVVVAVALQRCAAAPWQRLFEPAAAVEQVQQAQIDAAKALQHTAAEQQQQQLLAQQQQNQATAASGAAMQAHLQNAAAAFDASSVASADNVRKVVSLADMVAAMKADEIASRQAQIAFNTKIEADRTATDSKLAALESSAQDAFAVINQQLADVKATSNVMTARIEAVASSFATAHSAAATLAAAAHAEAATTAAAQKLQLDTVMAMLAKLVPAASTACSSAPEAEAAPPTTTLAIVSAPAEPVANDGDDAGAESPFVSGAVPAARRKAVS